tara:strand:+ start:502 stop:864 length:363 start_codon:yes stop_codon:yes gene_type:complete
MKKSEFKAQIKEEIIEILSEVSKSELDDISAQVDDIKDKIDAIDLSEVNEIDDDEMDKKATSAAKKGDSVSKIASKLQDTTKEMKKVVKKWKDSEGEEKAKLTDRLRELTKIKKELESLL